MTPEAQFHELSYYTLQHTDPAFVHQYVVDAYGAQQASASDKPIRLAFALVGLFLHVERGCTGRQVQLLHMRLAASGRPLPMLTLPASRGSIRIGDVLAVPPGAARDACIDRWCASVWQAFRDNRPAIVEYLRDFVPVR